MGCLVCCAITELFVCTNTFQVTDEREGSTFPSPALCLVVGHLYCVTFLWKVCSDQKKNCENSVLLSETGACTFQFCIILHILFSNVCIDLFFFVCLHDNFCVLSIC